MSIEISHRSVIAGGAVSITSQAVARSGSAAIGIAEVLPAAQAGALTTRTSDSAGTITMTSGDHTIETADVIDIYWAGGVRYGAVVGTVSTTAVPITGGSGDNLPAADTALTLVPQFDFNVAIDGDNCKMLILQLESNITSDRDAAHVQFLDSGSAEIAEIDLIANVAKIYDIAGGDTNPFTGNPIVSGKASCSSVSTTKVYTLKIIGVADASP